MTGLPKAFLFFFLRKFFASYISTVINPVFGFIRVLSSNFKEAHLWPKVVMYRYSLLKELFTPSQNACTCVYPHIQLSAVRHTRDGCYLVLDLYPGLLSLLFVACHTNVGGGLVNLSR